MVLDEALALWRGEALIDVAESPYAASVAVRLYEMRLAAEHRGDRAAALNHRRG